MRRPLPLVILAAALTACPPAQESGVESATDTDTDTGALPAPTGLEATGGVREVGLTWRRPAGGNGYLIQRSGVTGGPYREIGRAAVPRFTDTDLTPGDTLYYVVIAANQDGESLPSTEAFATVSGR